LQTATAVELTKALSPPSPLAMKRTADEARRRMESQLSDLAALERELDRLDGQLSLLRARLAGSRERLS
jgi:hypothetical protein